MRIIVDLLLVLSALFLPWWLTIFCACVLFFVFERFYELFLVALFMDLLYGVPTEMFAGSEFILSILGVCLYFLLAFAKKRMRI
ncbi:MAG: hypothetical protein A2849_04065 [Candidatus Taylorbacteria bacterium RIFCSPHIGHO2_01_FULL_51_15]|uniref:Uncharacterized protein n=1 Tax=Candidatus Taylorbacteria bacterium RIFCSPHIGHO2_01_FULL_51_15 TaxID=1802304 RepID=A0A1G2M8G5_9BACT|nr:MAG: hypothetical protein A2849_04065 [Candidatus Taylorbacteria bacterium RIFCSPHIGHO2_01_FULL_51_15]